MRHWTERMEPPDAAGPRKDVAETFEEIVEKEWGPTGRPPLQRPLPDSRYSCIAPFWI